MHIDTFIRTPVGADYADEQNTPASGKASEADKSASGKPTTYPDACVKTHYRPRRMFPIQMNTLKSINSGYRSIYSLIKERSDHAGYHWCRDNWL